MAEISVVILTYNEEIHIARAIKSVKSFAAEVIVVDSYSNDRTTEIAESLGARIFFNRFVNQANQFQWAMDHCEIRSPWIMRLDADEIIYPDLSEEINSHLPQLDESISGINLKRRHIFMNRWIKHGGRYPLLMLRIFRNGKGTVEDRWMDEHIQVSEGRTITFTGGFADHNLFDLSYFIDKHNRYATREAIEVINSRHELFSREALSAEGSSGQASFKRWLKENAYNKVPFTVSSTAYFLWRYVVQGGFLDGREGLTYHFLQGYWYRFLVGAKVVELEAAIAHLDEKGHKIDELSRLTGHNLAAGKL
ncbi:glycosyltransferase family 2 protein [Stenotrophomonas sp. GD03993]|uniref:glycosyltransferase family 2 protein n=1 Tax=unclassified Stenotrophomonas TaxID=196198 RepID=UPI001312B809|nr:MULTISPECIES: glycosyltransferase family 2 protein [Stenotrophomonas]MBH1461096.1 glycosyltransferase family 2 protein [Stenotrophomonas maltophilia]MDH0189392.1 glycosyltransferase family 2 protein [Stenotrophomonas sp. GD04051]MDH0464508.1 glycosyltransferase family 2 protein [Stenotrophomonas sp. GD03993]MDH0877014.1 glycosyltransferase family 2 protein [Stenotrophomonas sp. GD03877]MDH2156534.1 glycosyltransferase family 2 protein [Stenotrophomonas sp. GD03657]